MFVDFPELPFHELVFLGSDFLQVEVSVPLLVVSDQVRVAREVLEAYFALKDLDWKTFWLLEHRLIRLKRLFLQLQF